MTWYKILAMAIVIVTLGNTINIFLILKRIDALEFIQLWISHRVGRNEKRLKDQMRMFEVNTDDETANNKSR